MQYPPAAADPVDAGLPDGVPGRAEAGGKPSAGGTDPSAPGGSQSDGQTGPQGGTAISDGNRRVLEGWAAPVRCISKKRGTNK